MGAAMRYRIPIESLKAVINPLDGDMWQVEPIDPEEVRDAAGHGQVYDRPWAAMQTARLPRELHRAYHLGRLAWLLSAEADADDEHRITLCVSADRTWFFDGNHRAAAAMIRGDDAIDVWIAESGEIDLDTLFPGLSRLEPSMPEDDPGD